MHILYFTKKKRKKKQLLELPVAQPSGCHCWADREQQGARAQPPSHTLSQGNPKPQNPEVLRAQNEGETTLSHIPHATARYHISR